MQSMMTKLSTVVQGRSWATAIGMAGVLSLSGCQTLNGYKTTHTSANARQATSSQGISRHSGEVSITCEGMHHCDITQVDKKLLISSETHQPISKSDIVPTSYEIAKNASPNQAVKLVAQAPSNMNNLTKYFVRILPSKREVHVDFYPEDNEQYSERFAIIHDFAVPGDYRLKAYRMPNSRQSAGSLLASASPNPLCVALEQDGKTIRRFCKLPIDSRQNEFIEVTDIDPNTIMEALMSADEAQFS